LAKTVRSGQIWVVGGQKQQPRACNADGLPHGFAFVALQIMENHDVAWLQRWNEKSLNPGKKVLTVDVLIEGARRGNRIAAEGSDKSHRLPLNF